MAYKTSELYDKAKELIKEHNLFFIEDVVALLCISTRTFYDHFPTDSQDSQSLKELLYLNKIKTKLILREQMQDANTSTDRIALYKLIGEPEELRRLSNNYNDSDVNGQTITIIHKNDDEQ